MPDLRHVLILGGTSEARGIVATLLAKGAVRVTFSLAGALGDEARASFYRKLGECDKTNLELRVGGFGGAEGLRDYLLVNGIDSMIDATHPYAARMSHNACEAARLASVPLVRFVRPAWQPTTKDNWLEVEDLDAAAAALPEGARVFLALGSQSIAPFLKRSDCQLMARSLVDPAFSRKAHMHIVKGAPGGSVQQESDLFRTHGIEYLVSKNSGSDLSYNKILAAGAFDIKVIMVRRPHLPPCSELNDIESILDWLQTHG